MMFYKRLAHKNEEAKPGGLRRMYADRVNEMIRARYSVSDELAIIRQRDTKPEEFEEYNAFVEGCKATAREEILL